MNIRPLTAMLAALLLSATPALAGPAPQPVRLSASERQSLEAIVTLVSSASGGKERLLDTPISATTRTGATPLFPGKGKPHVSVWPVSSPVNADIAGVGEGILLGAIHIPLSACAPDGKKEARSGVYLIFIRTLGRLGSFQVTANEISLVSASRKDGKPFYRTALAAPLMGHDAQEGSDKPEVTVSFPAHGETSANNPAWRVTIQMKWKEHLFGFRLDIDIPMV